MLYAYASSQLVYLRFRRASLNAKAPAKLHDPLALEARPGQSSIRISRPHADTTCPPNTVEDLLSSLVSAPKILPDILPALVPYALVVAAFGTFVVWNGGIVLGKSLHY